MRQIINELDSDTKLVMQVCFCVCVCADGYCP